MKFKRIQFLIILLALFTACNDDITEVIDNNAVRLTKKTWTFESLTGFDELTNSLASSLLDGTTYDFNIDGSYNAVNLGQPKSGTWEFNTPMTIITLNAGTNDALEWTIITLTDTRLIITQPDSQAIDGKVTLTFN